MRWTWMSIRRGEGIEGVAHYQRKCERHRNGQNRKGNRAPCAKVPLNPATARAKLPSKQGGLPMKRPMPRITTMPGLLQTFALASLLALGAPAAGQDWPARPMTMVIPFAAAGGVDVVGRIMGARMAEILGRPVVIENVGGAGGMVGSSRVAKGAP